MNTPYSDQGTEPETLNALTEGIIGKDRQKNTSAWFS